ncbi:MAG: 5-formyltetrahydrofolate cyclo-ligase [Clostridiales bacterium]|nr:5-formyltetrahydrofolate cyclo-ligase [Clostridiales bacterium]
MDGTKDFTYSDKAAVRSELLRIRAEITDKLLKSTEIARRALTLVRGNVMTYISIDSEVDTVYLNDELLKRGDIVLFAPYTVNGKILPRRVKRFDKPDKYGNMPSDCYFASCKIKGIFLDYCITPLVGFNDGGYRIGYGKGCYDKFFCDFSARKVGLAFESQHANFSEQAHDIPLDCCVTEQKVIYF